MDCERISEMLSAYLDGEEHEEESLAVRGHIESCSRCREVLADWEAIDRLAEEGTAAAAAVPIGRGAAPSRGARRRLVPLLAAAAAISVLAASTVLAARAPGQAGGPVATVRSDHSSPQTFVSTSPEASAQPQPNDKPPASEPAPPAGESRYSRVTDGELTLFIGVRSNVVRAGERVVTKVALVNTTDHPVRFLSFAESPIDVVLRGADGGEAYRRSRAEGWSGELVERTLAPRESISEAVSFPAPKPGRYLLSAECPCARDYPEVQSPGSGKSPPGSQAGSGDRSLGGDSRPVPPRGLETPPIKTMVTQSDGEVGVLD